MSRFPLPRNAFGRVSPSNWNASSGKIEGTADPGSREPRAGLTERSTSSTGRSNRLMPHLISAPSVLASPPAVTMTVGSLCTGYGGLEMALRLAGWPVELAWVADSDPGATTLLAHRHPDVPNLDDITSTNWSAVAPVDVITAGYPCQPFSDAGLRKAEDDDRYLWPAVANAVRLVRPRWVLLENVRGHLGRGFAQVVADLAALGYVGSWVCVRASDVGAPHRRERVFCLATDAARLGHGYPWTPGGQRVSAATVGGAVRPDGVADLLPTPNAALGRGTGFPSPETAQDRMDRGTRCLDDAVALLPTPRTNDGRGAGVHGTGGPDLRTVVDLLPTPRARDHKGRDPNPRGVDLNEALALLPTPRATDGSNQRGSSGDLMLPSAVMLLPTPVAHDTGRSPEGHIAMRTGTGHSSVSSLAVAAALLPDRWGQYAPAIARWEQVIGRPAPDPTEPGKNGQPRLSARFVEWMQGLPEGWVTGVPGLTRNQMLRLLGNGVVPQQGAHALPGLGALGGA